MGELVDATARFADARVDAVRERLEGDCARAIELTDEEHVGGLQIVNDDAGGEHFVASTLGGQATGDVFPLPRR